jgi:hypothetical protein
VFGTTCKAILKVMTQTIAQQIKWDFETNGELEIRDKIIGNLIYIEFSNGLWGKNEYDSKGNQIYFENSNGYWEKWEYDSKGNVIYFEDSKGVIKDNRPKSCEGKEIVIGGEKFKLVKV